MHIRLTVNYRAIVRSFVRSILLAPPRPVPPLPPPPRPRFELRARFFLTMSSTFFEFFFPRSFMFLRGHSLRSNRARYSECCRYSPASCYCCAFAFVRAEEIPRDRVHRQLHIDRILENRQFRSTTTTIATTATTTAPSPPPLYIMPIQIRQSETYIKSVDNQVTWRSRFPVLMHDRDVAKKFTSSRRAIRISLLTDFSILKHTCRDTARSLSLGA